MIHVVLHITIEQCYYYYTVNGHVAMLSGTCYEKQMFQSSVNYSCHFLMVFPSWKEQYSHFVIAITTYNVYITLLNDATRVKYLYNYI